jgi:multicomponent Na+:H+ antiporter subunit F
MTVVVIAGAVMLAVAALLAVFRLIAGPSRLDRAAAYDVLIAITLVGIGMEAAYNRHTTTLPILMVVSIVGFVGSVCVARFAMRRDGD